jgi:hypothetical protein
MVRDEGSCPGGLCTFFFATSATGAAASRFTQNLHRLIFGESALLHDSLRLPVEAIFARIRNNRQVNSTLGYLSPADPKDGNLSLKVVSPKSIAARTFKPA